MAPREGRVGLTIYVEPKLRTALKRLALDRGASVEALVTEALEKLISHHQKGSCK